MAYAYQGIPLGEGRALLFIFSLGDWGLPRRVLAVALLLPCRVLAVAWLFGYLRLGEMGCEGNAPADKKRYAYSPSHFDEAPPNLLMIVRRWSTINPDGLDSLFGGPIEKKLLAFPGGILQWVKVMRTK